MYEEAEQKTVVEWFRIQYPKYEKCMRASQSGGFKGHGKAGAIRMKKIIAMGGVKGESDIALLISRGGFGCLLIELKADNARRGATREQLEYVNFHNEIGNCAVVTKGVDMAIAAIKQYMDLVKDEIKDSG